MTYNKFIRGVKVTEDLLRELSDDGRTHVLQLKDHQGKLYLAHFETRQGDIIVVPEVKFLEHRCPHCGGRIRITSKGYWCEHAMGKHPSCKFHCNGILSHRFIMPAEVEAWLSGHPTILDGCYNSQGKIFSAILTEDKQHGMSLTSVIGRCPLCGGQVMVSPVAFNCCQRDGELEPYHLSLWRHVKGHAVTLDELNELLADGITSHEVILNDENGTLSKAFLRLSDDKKRIIPAYAPVTVN